jgi:hypothetical protein
VWVDGAGSFLQLGTTATSLIIPVSQTINTDQAFSDAQHGIGGAGGVLDGSGNISVQGPYLWQSGTMQGTGSTTVLGGLQSGTGTDNLTLSRSLVLGDGTKPSISTLSLTGAGNLVFNGGSLTIMNQATFDLGSDAGLMAGGGTNNLTIENGGVLQKSNAGTTSTVAVPLTNNGLVNVRAGTLMLTGGGSGTGTFQVNTVSTLTFASGAYSINDDTGTRGLTGAGTIQVDGATVTLLGSIGGSDHLTGALAVTGGSLNAIDSLVVLTSGQTLNPSGTMVNVTGGTATFNNSVLTCTDCSITGSGRVLNVEPGGTVVSTSSFSPLINLFGGIVSFASRLFGLTGSNTAVDPGTGLDLGTDRPLQGSGGGPVATSLVSVSGGGQLSVGKLVKIDTALLEASAPLLSMSGNTSVFTVNGDSAVDLAFKANVTSIGPMIVMTGGTFNVNGGPLFNLAGGSLLTVTGDLIMMSNGSTLNLNSTSNGFLISASAGSVLNVSGGIVNFGGTGGNSIVVNNTVAPTTTLNVGGVSIPVHLENGATIGQVTIQGTPVKNTGLGSITFPNTGSLINVNGSTAKVTIKGQ